VKKNKNKKFFWGQSLRVFEEMLPWVCWSEIGPRLESQLRVVG
jgi:hypothetical protein